MNDYEDNLKEYAKGFNEQHISDLCRVLNDDQITTFELFLRLRREATEERKH